jgi:hypothetical protein
VHQIRGYQVRPDPARDLWAELLELRREIQVQDDLAKGLGPHVLREPSVIGAVALPNPRAETWVTLSVRFSFPTHAPAGSGQGETAKGDSQGRANGCARSDGGRALQPGGSSTWCFLSQLCRGGLHPWRLASIMPSI